MDPVGREEGRVGRESGEEECGGRGGRGGMEGREGGKGGE